MKENTLIKKTGLPHFLMFISLNAMSVMFAFRYGLILMVTHILLSVFVSYWVIFKERILEKIFFTNDKKPNLYWCCIATSAVSVAHASTFFKNLFTMFEKLGLFSWISIGNLKMTAAFILVITITASYFSIFVFVYAFYEKILTFFWKEKNVLDKIEKKYLKILLIIMTIIFGIIFNSTNLFYCPTENGFIRQYDVVYTGDTGNHFCENVWINIGASENDIRQPLFAIFSIPFAIIPFVISKVLFFVPNCYAILIAIMQVLLMAYSYILIARLLKLKGTEKFFFLVMCTFTYPFLLFSLNLEQYVFATFWLIMMIYSALTDRKNLDYLYIAATGSMLTSGILFFLLSKSSKIKEWIIDIYNVATKFFMTTILSGQVIIFVLLVPSLKRITRFADSKALMSDKISQFMNFVASCFLAPKTRIDDISFKHVSWQLESVYTINIIGVIILLLTIVGYLSNRKDNFAKICMTWITFSFVILCLFGWGVKENGLILYTLYFSWAYVALIVLFLKKFIKKEILRNCLWFCSIVAIFSINISSICSLVKFGFEFYPVL